jgi:hypothetical protein
MQTQKKGRTNATNQQPLVESTNGMGGVMNEEDLETRVIKHQVQITIEDVTTLTPNWEY